MNKRGKARPCPAAILVAIIGICLLPAITRAHCDTTNGPIIPEVRMALEKRDVTPVLKWIKPENEAEIKAAFAKSVAVRAQGPAARNLADRFFLETLIRLHRAGEGAPFTGLKDEPVEPVAAMADQALASGSADRMIAMLGNHHTDQ